jgi:hypothetical protein
MRTCLLCESTSAGTGVSFRRRRDICDWCDNELTRSGRAWCATGKHVVLITAMASGKPRCKACERKRNIDRRERPGYAKAWRALNAARLHAYHTRPDVMARKRASAKRRYWNNPDRARAQRRAQHYQRGALRSARRRLRYWGNVINERAASRQRYVDRKLAILRAWRGP